MPMLLEAIKSICQDPPAIMVLAGVVAAVLVLVCLLLMLLKGRRLALRTAATARDLIADMKSLREQLEEAEKRVDRRLAGLTGEVDERVNAGLTERLAASRRELDEGLARLDASASSLREDMDGLRTRLDEVEGRVPGLLDQLDELRETLGRTFQSELSGVLSSFDTSVAGILEQMKSELQIGISRIEGIEQMVRGRERAERALLAGASDQELEAGEDEESSRFAEWEQEAKDLAESESDEPGAEDEDEPVPDEREDEAQDHPGEMNADEADDTLESALYDDTEKGEPDEDKPDAS
jgi:hypothetical protein